MKRIGIIDLMNENRIGSLKRNLLFFDSLMYDNSHVNTYTNYLKSFSQFNQLEDSEIKATIEYLTDKNVLEKFKTKPEDLELARQLPTEFEDLASIFKNEVLNYKQISDKIDKSHLRAIEGINKKLQTLAIKITDNEVQQSIKAMLSDKTLLGSHSLRIISILKSITNSNDIHIPIINNANLLPSVKNTVEEEVIKVILSNIPIPNDKIPFDEILDFRKSKDAKLKYGRLISWVKKLSTSTVSKSEIEEEFLHLMNEYEHRMGLEKENKYLTQIDLTLRLPLEVAEKIVKIQWSKIPETFLQFRKNRNQFLINETKAPGKEISYIQMIKENIK